MRGNYPKNALGEGKAAVCTHTFTCHDISESSQERLVSTQKTFRFSFQSAVGLGCAEKQALQFRAHGVASVSCVPQPLALLSASSFGLSWLHTHEGVIPSFLAPEDLVQGGARIPTSSNPCSCVNGLS